MDSIAITDVILSQVRVQIHKTEINGSFWKYQIKPLRLPMKEKKKKKK